MPIRAVTAVTIAAAAAGLPDARAASLVPAPVVPSALTLQIEHAGTVGLPGGSTNIAEPVAIGDDLYIVDKGAGTISIARPGGQVVVLDGASLPEDVTLASGAGIINIAGSAERVFVGVHSSTLPVGFGTPAPLPGDPGYRTDTPRYDLIYRYDRAPDGTLADPVPVAAFDATTNGHRGGGMLGLPDGRLLYARGDGLNQNFNGLDAPQDAASTLGKLLILDPETGAVEVAAMGLRNPQRLTWADAGRERILLSDIGWTVAEEINALSLADLTDARVIENFGWGRNPVDGLAREGGFYVSEGPEASATVLGVAPVGEAGFLQPLAEFGREDRDGLFAVSGPLVSEASFVDIGVLFGDLVGGDLFATRAGAEGPFAEVLSIGLVDDAGLATDLRTLLGTDRIDLRFFAFPDGGAGLLSERTGDLFRVTETAVVPLPAALPMLGMALAALGMAGRRRERSPA